MSKFYNAALQQRSKFPGKFFVGMLLCLVGIFGTVKAQVSVSSSAGVTVPTNYLNFKAAFDAINAGTHQGTIAITITSNTVTETAQAVLNSSSLPSNYSSISIRPTQPGTVVSGSISTSLFKFLGADKVTIDGFIGAGPTRDLTFTNTFSSGGTTTIWIASASGTDGATYDTIRNCIITGASSTGSYSAITQSSNTTVTASAEAPNSGNTYSNNVINSSYAGITVLGRASNEDVNTTITGNTITNLGQFGIEIARQKDMLISGNTISGINSSLGSLIIQNAGIIAYGTMIRGVIEKNTISNVRINTVWGCSGIMLQCTSTATDLIVRNNFIYDILNGGYTAFDSVDDNPAGIVVDDGGGYKIEYNSINMTGAQTASGSIMAGIWISDFAAVGAVSLRNNNIVVPTGTFNRFAVYTNTTQTVFSAINYNNYYSPSGSVGFLSTNRTTLANWQAATGADGNSVSIDPLYISATNLHLQPVSPLEATGTPIAGATQDIDGDTRNATTPDIGADEFTPNPCINPVVGGTAVASINDICVSGSSVLSASGYSIGVGMVYQWQWSSTGGVPWNAMGANPLVQNTGVITATTYYRLQVQCSGGAFGYSNTVQVNVNNPTVTSPVPGTRCGVGTVTLAASGSNIQWYTTSSGGNAIGTGSPFTTPEIAVTTTYYATSANFGPTIIGGKPSTTGASGSNNVTDAGLVFDVNQRLIINSVKMYPQATGTVRIEVLTSAGVQVPGCQADVALVASGTTGQVVTLAGFTVPIGIGYRLVVTQNASSIGMFRDFSPTPYPYTLGSAGSITGGWLAGSSTNYYYFYDWHISTACESPRVPITATVTTPPALTTLLPAAGPARTICQGQSVVLDASGGGYTTYTWNPGSLTSPATVTPTITTTYTLTANIPGGCRRDEVITINVVPTPTPLAITPGSGSVCTNYVVGISTTGGQIPNQDVFTELADVFPLTKFTVGGSGVNMTQSTSYFSQGGSSIRLTHTDGANGWIESNSIALAGYVNPMLTFSHIAGLEASTGFHWDVGYVEYSDNGGAWTKFPAASYLGTGGLQQQIDDVSATGVGFDNTSYADWDNQFTSGTSTPGAAPATSLWKAETINLTTWQASANFKIRFRLLTDNISIQYYGWLIDNIKIRATGQAPINWTACPGNLYTSATHTTPITCGTSYPNVFYWSAGTSPATTYTATAVGGGGCNSTATITLSADATSASVSIASNLGITVCSGQSVTVTATPVNGGTPPGYQWFKNGISQGPSTLGANTFTFVPVPGDFIDCIMSINPSAGGCLSGTRASNTLTFTVNPTPTANNITGTSTVCTGTPTTLTEVPVGTITTWQWYLDGAPVSTSPNTYNASAPGSYTVAVGTAFGCKDTSDAFVVTQPTYAITVTAGPNGTITTGGTNPVPCGNNITFTITANPGYSIQDVVVNGSSVGPVGTYTFTNVTATGTISATFFVAGCATPATSSAGPNAVLCNNKNHPLAGTIGGSATSGTWTTSGSGTFNPSNVYGTATSYTASAADVTAGSVTLTLTTNDPVGPCPASVSTMTLTIRQAPSVDMSGILGLCSASGTTILVADTTGTLEHITGFQWYHPYPTTTGPNNDSLNVASGATGNYTVEVTGVNGCKDTANVNVVVFTAPSVTISGTGPICTDAGVDLTAIGVAGSGTIPTNGYKWYRNTILIPGQTSSILTATSAGNYTVTVTTSNGCTSPLSPIVTLAMDNSPLNGFYTIGVGVATCTNYISFARAINDLNTRGISGNVTFSIPGGYTETVPYRGLKLGSATLNPQTATGKTISFTKSSSGANPLLTAFTGGVGLPNNGYPDGIFCLRGVDNVSISQIDLTENAANTTASTQMEYGYGLFKYTVSDGAQNNTIQNCKITLNKANAAATTAPMTEGSNGIVVINAVDTSTVAMTPTVAAGTNSYNKFYGNTINNVHGGIILSGYAAAGPSALTDTNNDLGGTGSSSGNIITNFGNTGDINPPWGVRVINQWGVNVSYNTINNNDGAGSNTTNTLRGIYTTGGVGANGTISNNTISLKSNSAGSPVSGIDNSMGNSGIVDINTNDISGTSLLTTSSNFTGITNSATAATMNIINNNIHNITLAGTGSFLGIINSVVVTNLFINNNTVANNTKNSTGVMTLIGTGSPTNVTVNDNTLSGNTVTGGGATVTFTCILGNTSNYTVDNNFIYNNSVTGMTGASVATLYGYNNISAPVQETVTDNIVRKLFITGTSTGIQLLAGIRNITSTPAGHFRIVSRNSVDSLYSASTLTTTLTGIASGAGINVTVSGNKVHSLWPGQNGTGVSTAKGISISNGNVVKAFNNSVSLDLTQATAPAANNILVNATAMTGMEVSGGATINVYYNTVRMAGSGLANSTFGSSGISITNTATIVELKNNLVANYMTTPSGGTGFSAALRRSAAALTGYASTSNNNLWYSTGGTSTPLYYNSAAGFTTLALFKGNVTPRESASIGDNPVFVSIPLNDLHLNPANNCNIDGAGTPIATYTDDYDVEPRDATNPDIGMDEFMGTGTGYTWKGLNTNWENPANWCGGVPTAASDVIIPGGKAFYPIIITATPVAHNINIQSGGSITINNTGTLSNTGSWTNDGTLTNNGIIVLNGSGTPQSFPGAGAGSMPTMVSLTANNPAGVTLNKGFTLNGTLKPKIGQLLVQDVITLHSDASGTARVDTVQGTIAYSGVGKFSVERYISSATRTAWRFLAAPITGTQTIHDAWQEGQAAGAAISTGYGMQIVGPTSAGPGFDMNNSLPSVKKYDQATNNWLPIPGTLGPIAAVDGYMAFIRGDRDDDVFGETGPTTLRTAGQIKVGAVNVSTPNANVNKFISVGNPYPSAIDFGSTATTKTGLVDAYYLWDPKLAQYGGYQTFSWSSALSTYVPSPGGGSYGGGNRFIESGQAFFVVANASVVPHSITINENSKVGSNVQVARLTGGDAKSLSTRLFVASASGPQLYDGNRVDFDGVYSNVIDDNDIPKFSNFGENIGLAREGKSISVERRAEIVGADTIFFQLGQLRQQTYQLEFTPENLSGTGVTAYLEDAYLHTSTEVSLDAANSINFVVNADAGSKATDRFRIVFRQLAPVPVTFTTVTATRQDKKVLVSWKVENELNIAQYVVERSKDGRNFNGITAETARGNGNGITLQYSSFDNSPFIADNFYRIRSVGINGDLKYSNVVKVNMTADPAMITVYPNPVKADGLVKISLTNQPKGLYKINLLNVKGQLILTQSINHEGGNSVYELKMGTGLVHGNYLLNIISEANKVKTGFKILY